MAKNGVSKTVRVVANSTSPYYDTLYKNGDRPSGGGGGGTSSLSYVAANLNEGTVITINDSGNNLGVKTNVKPMYFAEPGVSGSIDSSALSRRAFQLRSSSGYPYQSIVGTDTLPGKSYAFQHALVDSNAEGITHKVAPDEIFGPLKTDLDGAGDKITVFATRKYNFGGLDARTKKREYYPNEDTGSPAMWNIKGWRFWATNSGGDWGGYPDIVVGYPGGGDSSSEIHTDFQIENPNQTFRISEHASASSITNKVAFGLNKDVWTNELLLFKQSSNYLNPSDLTAELTWYVQGNKWNITNFSTGNASAGSKMDRFYGHQFEHLYVDGAVDWNFKLSCFYLDDTQHFCVISDSATWSGITDGSIVEVQIPTEIWEEGQAKFSLRKGKFTSLSGKYLYICNNTSIVNENGLLLT